MGVAKQQYFTSLMNFFLSKSTINACDKTESRKDTSLSRTQYTYMWTHYVMKY